MDDHPIQVLLIEDDPADTRLIRELLADAHDAKFDVKCADRLEAGMEFLAHSATEVDVILLDLSLPDSQGLETFQTISVFGQTTPIVVLTGLNDASLAVQAMREGAQDYLLKGQVDSNLLARSLRHSIERKRLVTALRESEERYRDLFENVNDMIQSVTPQGRFEYVNRAWKTTLGYNDEDLADLTIFDIIHPDCQPHCLKVFKEILKGEQLRNVEAVFVARDGRCIDVEGNASCRFHEGKPIATRGIFRDITKRKQAEQQIRELNADLEQRVIKRTRQLAATNRELETFSYSVSHDLRAPLRRIDGFSLALLDNYGEMFDDQGKHFLNRVRSGVQHMGRLIDALLSLSRVNVVELHKQPVDFSEMARAILADCRAENPQHKVEERVAEGMVADGDSVLLHSVIQNLLGNAWKFSQTQSCPRIEFDTTILDGEKVFFIRDNGVGFDMSFADKLFGPFQRQHSQCEFEGIGIGLATVQRIIQRHDGRVWANGAVDEGATFYFTLPQTLG